MSRFRKLSQTLWYCQYHIVWVPKYRFRILTGKVAEEVENCIRAFSEQQGGEVVELNIQADHVHLLARISHGKEIPVTFAETSSGKRLAMEESATLQGQAIAQAVFHCTSAVLQMVFWHTSPLRAFLEASYCPLKRLSSKLCVFQIGKCPEKDIFVRISFSK